MKPENHEYWTSLNQQEKDSVLDLAANCGKTMGFASDQQVAMIGYCMVSALADSHASRSIAA